jgi:hypothetical protein
VMPEYAWALLCKGAGNVLDDTVIGHNMKRHRHQDFIRFLNTIEARVPKRKAIHAIVDNYATHKHPKVRRASGAGPSGPLSAVRHRPHQSFRGPPSHADRSQS